MRGDRIKNLRESHCLSRKEFANIICTTETIVQSWEQGWNIIPPSSGEIEAMADLFGLSEDQLLEALELDENQLYDNTPTVPFDFIDDGVRWHNIII